MRMWRLHTLCPACASTGCQRQSTRRRGEEAATRAERVASDGDSERRPAWTASSRERRETQTRLADPTDYSVLS